MKMRAASEVLAWEAPWLLWEDFENPARTGREDAVKGVMERYAVRPASAHDGCGVHGGCVVGRYVPAFDPWRPALRTQLAVAHGARGEGVVGVGRSVSMKYFGVALDALDDVHGASVGVHDVHDACVTGRYVPGFGVGRRALNFCGIALQRRGGGGGVVERYVLRSSFAVALKGVHSGDVLGVLQGVASATCT
eukprot:gene20075-biopygen6493